MFRLKSKEALGESRTAGFRDEAKVPSALGSRGEKVDDTPVGIDEPGGVTSGHEGGVGGSWRYIRTPKANKSVELIFDYCAVQGGSQVGDGLDSEEGKSRGDGGGGDNRGVSLGVRGGDGFDNEDKDPRFNDQGLKNPKPRMSLLKFGRRNKRAFEGAQTPNDDAKGKKASVATPSTPISEASRRTVAFGDNFHHMPHIGETLLEHQRRCLVPILINLADKSNARVADNASTLISDAMHLRNVNSHRWNRMSLRFYKARNSHAYHVVGFLLITAHTALSVFEAPRDEWEFVTDYLKFASESIQKDTCYTVNVVILTLYVLDVVIQLLYQRISWHEVDWASDYVKKRGEKNVKEAARSFRNHAVSSLRTSSVGGSELFKPKRMTIYSWVLQSFSDASKLTYNSIFLCNFAVVAFMVYATLTSLSSKGAFLRPVMYIFMNYRIQTACGAFIKMLPQLTDILVIIFFFIVVYAAMTCLLFSEIPSVSSNPEEGFNSFWYALLNYYVLLSTENFPQILERFDDNFVAWFFITFLVIGYFIFMAYMTAIVFDGYYDVKIQISLQEYLTERSALVTAFLCIAYDPLGNIFNEVLTLGDLIEANLTFHGNKATIDIITELFLELDVDGSKTLDEDEFYHFCDAVVSQVEKLRDADLFAENPATSSFSSNSMQSDTGEGARKRISFTKTPSGLFSGVLWHWRRFFRKAKLQCVSFFEAHVDKLVSAEGTHILFNHILQIFRSGLIQIFFILALIWIFLFAIVAMNVLGAKECINKVTEALGEDIPYYERFDTFPNSMLAMFRMATGSGWNDIMFLYWPCESPWGGTNFSPFFFVFFHFSFCIVFYNVLGGLIFAQYKQLADSKENKKRRREKQRRKVAKKNRKRRNTRRLSLTGSGDKRGSLKSGGRRASQIPEMRKSARFWREALGKEGGGEERTTTGRSTPGDGMDYDSQTTGVDGGIGQIKKMQELYEKHMFLQSTHIKAKVLLGRNPYSSMTINHMAGKLLKPASGLKWDMTIINAKHAMRRDSGTHDSGTHEVDSRVRSSSVGTEEVEAAEGGGVTIASRRSSWLTSMGVTGGGHKGGKRNWGTNGGGAQTQENSGQTIVGVEMKSFGRTEKDRSASGSINDFSSSSSSGSDEDEQDEHEEEHGPTIRRYRRSLGRRQQSDVFI